MWEWIRRLWNRQVAEQDLEREIRAHLEWESEEQREAGVPAAEAPYAARRAFGNPPQIREECRDASGWMWLERLAQDVRSALRGMRKKPVYSAVAILTLALGMGANTAIFSVVSGILLRPLAYRDPDRLVTILHNGNDPVSPGDFLDWQKQSRSFVQMAGAGLWSAALTGRDRPEQITGMSFTEGMFEMLGVRPLYGRTLLPEDFRPSGQRVVVLSHRLWQRRFGADRGIVGQTLAFDGAPYQVVGVMPPSFQFSPFWVTEAELWVPLSLSNRAGDRGGRFMRVFGRLKPGVGVAQAQAEMDAVCLRLGKAYPDDDAGMTVRVIPLRDKAVGDVRPALLVLLGAVAFVLLIACTNIANLALARAGERQKELAIRFALGASRGRILQQLLTESVVLSLIGGALGLVLAYLGLDALKALVEQGASRYSSRLPRIHEISIDGAVLAISGLVAVATGIFFGLIPGLQAARTAVNDSLKEGGRGTSDGKRSLRLRGALVVSEVAISLVLLAGAGLLLRSFLLLRAIDPGFQTQRVLTMTVSVAGHPQYAGPQREIFYRRVAEAISALPGVESVGMTNHLPLAGDTWGVEVFPEGRPLPRPGERNRAVYRVCRPGYFRTMDIPLRRGRDFSDRDTAAASAVIIVNKRLADQFWPSENPIGKRITLDDPRGKPVWRTVVGAIPSVKQGGWSDEPDNEIYLPFQQDQSFFAETGPQVSYMTLVIRTANDPNRLVNAARQAIWALDADITVSDVQSLEEVIANSLWSARFHVLILGLFGGFAIVLAAVGIYGVMAGAVSRRTHEIGIRMALGARKATVLWLVLRQGMALVFAGIVIGTGAALAITRLMAKLLYGVKATDPVTFATIPIVLATVALVATYLPARRASSVDPVVALRSE